jgi:hypothetical protein
LTFFASLSGTTRYSNREVEKVGASIIGVVAIADTSLPLKVSHLGNRRIEDAFAPEQLNELGQEGWEAVGLSLKYGDFIAWPVVLLKRPLE